MPVIPAPRVLPVRLLATLLVGATLIAGCTGSASSTGGESGSGSSPTSEAANAAPGETDTSAVPFPDPIPNGTWKQARGGTVCVSDEEGRIPDGVTKWAVCQHLGPFQLGLRFSEMTDPLQPPVRKLVDTDSTKGYAYALRPADDEAQNYPYLIVAAVRDTVTLLQLTGPPLHENVDLDFASIHLGDPSNKVKNVLGDPVSQSPVQEVEGVTIWDYGKSPFSVEMRGGQVYSIRLWWRGRVPQGLGGG